MTSDMTTNYYTAYDLHHPHHCRWAEGEPGQIEGGAAEVAWAGQFEDVWVVGQSEVAWAAEQAGAVASAEELVAAELGVAAAGEAVAFSCYCLRWSCCHDYFQLSSADFEGVPASAAASLDWQSLGRCEPFTRVIRCQPGGRICI